MTDTAQALVTALRGAWVTGAREPASIALDLPAQSEEQVAARVRYALASFLIDEWDESEPSATDDHVFSQDITDVGVSHASSSPAFQGVLLGIEVIVGPEPLPRTAPLAVHVTTRGGRHTEVVVSGASGGKSLDPLVAQSMATCIAAALERVPDPAAPALTSGDETTPTNLVESILGHAVADTTRTAVETATGSMTYGELVAKAGAYARLLDSRGAPSIVAVTFRRMADDVVALLGVLLSGRAYLLLNEADSLEFRAALVRRVGAVEAPSQTMTDAADEVVPRQVPPEAAAYVILTSGTTGRPKAVVVGRGQLDNYVAFLTGAGICGPDVVMPVLSAPGFDAIVKQIWGQLAAGGAVLLPTDLDVVRSVERSLKRDGVCINTVPSLWREVLDVVPTSPVQGTLLLGGESLSPSLVEQTRRHFPGLDIVNLYGPSEGTSNATWHRVGALDRDIIPIGLPITGASVLVTDRTFRPVPMGAVGRLMLAGAGLATGYLEDGRRTASAFLPCPSGAPGSRAYDTGDLVRFTSDGLVFLGRADTEVKVNGVRADLIGLSSDVEDLPEVAGAIVDAHGGALSVYVVATGDDKTAVSAVEDHIRRAWRSEFSSAKVHVVDRIPRTNSGKADLNALRLIPASTVVPSAPPATPSPAAEDSMVQLLQTLWGHTLATADPVPTDATFSTLGGDSLKTLKLIALYRRLLKADVSLTDFAGQDTLEAHRSLLRERVDDAAVATATATLARSRS